MSRPAAGTADRIARLATSFSPLCTVIVVLPLPSTVPLPPELSYARAVRTVTPQGTSWSVPSLAGLTIRQLATTALFWTAFTATDRVPKGMLAGETVVAAFVCGHATFTRTVPLPAGVTTDDVADLDPPQPPVRADASTATPAPTARAKPATAFRRLIAEGLLMRA
jgi:hypothetical protein